MWHEKLIYWTQIWFNLCCTVLSRQANKSAITIYTMKWIDIYNKSKDGWNTASKAKKSTPLKYQWERWSDRNVLVVNHRRHIKYSSTSIPVIVYAVQTSKRNLVYANVCETHVESGHIIHNTLKCYLLVWKGRAFYLCINICVRHLCKFTSWFIFYSISII